MATFEDAVAEYIRRKYNYKATDKITEVDFGIEYGGGCPTCAYEYVALKFKKNGRANDIDISYISAGEFVADVAKIYTELGGR